MRTFVYPARFERAMPASDSVNDLVNCPHATRHDDANHFIAVVKDGSRLQQFGMDSSHGN